LARLREKADYSAKEWGEGRNLRVGTGKKSRVENVEEQGDKDLLEGPVELVRESIIPRSCISTCGVEGWQQIIFC
jgi:hypothetical protein